MYVHVNSIIPAEAPPAPIDVFLHRKPTAPPLPKQDLLIETYQEVPKWNGHKTHSPWQDIEVVSAHRDLKSRIFQVKSVIPDPNTKSGVKVVIRDTT